MHEKLQSIVMSSNNDFQDSQFSVSSSTRRKVDVLNLPENGNLKERASSDSKYNLRMSLAWDSAFFTSPGVLEPDELFSALNSRNLDNPINILGSEEHLLLSSQSLEPDTINRVRNVSFRKSLAWDNGFFTSEGVLDPFELAIVNNGFKQCENHLLPVSEDEVRGSIESSSTLDSEGFSLTRLEKDLFEDIRASRPRPTTSSFELAAPAKRDSSQTKIKAIPNGRRQSTNKHGLKRITREKLDAPKIQLKQTTSSSLKPPKASEQANYTSRGSAERAPLREQHFKPGCRSGISASVECLGKSKKPRLRDSWNAIHGSAQFLKSSLSHSPVPANKSVSSTSRLCRGAPSDITPPYLRRKISSGGLNLPAAGSASVTPLVKKRLNKMEVESSCHHAYLQSTPTSASYESPSSSIDEWSSESSSTSAARRFIRCKPSLHASLESFYSEERHLEPYVRHETLANLRHRKELMGGGDANASSILREMKPSGLRMPSPKIGYFDAKNMLALATKGESPGGTVVANSKGAANRTRCSQLQSPGILASSGSKKTGPQKDAGTPISVLATRRTSDHKYCLDAEDTGSQTRDNRAPTRKPYGKILQCSKNNNQSLKAQETIVHYPDLDFDILDDGNKENVISFVDQIEGLTKQVNSIDLNKLL